LDRFKTRIRDEFLRISNILGRHPLRVDMLKMMDESLYQAMRKTSSENIFRDYLKFLDSMGIEQRIDKEYDTIARLFIRTLERTSMSKLYKLPVIRTFFDSRFWSDSSDSEYLFKLTVTPDELVASFRAFY